MTLLRLRRELEIEHRIASNAARTDELTGLNNLRAFKEQADTMFTASRRNGLPLCALLVDIDHFKQINDTHGHATGDRVLQAVAQALKTTLREADLCGRLGGEEFGVLLTGTNLHEALQLAEKLRLAIQAIVVPMDNTSPSASGWPKRARPVLTSPPCWPRPMRPCTTPRPTAATGCMAAAPNPRGVSPCQRLASLHCCW